MPSKKKAAIGIDASTPAADSGALSVNKTTGDADLIATQSKKAATRADAAPATEQQGITPGSKQKLKSAAKIISGASAKTTAKAPVADKANDAAPQSMERAKVAPTAAADVVKTRAIAQTAKTEGKAKDIDLSKVIQSAAVAAKSDPSTSKAAGRDSKAPVAENPARESATVPTTLAASETTEVAKKAPEKAAVAVAPVAPKVVEPSSSASVETKPGQAKPVAAKPKTAAGRQGFKTNEFIVYPAHGVGQIIGIEVQEVAGFSLELFVVSFIKDKMILKVPTSKVASVGMRKLADSDVVEKALGVLSGRARIKRTMWSRRAQEYEAKINSGDLVTIAEVVRDLYRSDTQPEQSYSERQLYEAALDRMAREVAAVRRLIDSESLKLIESFLLKGPRRGQKSEADSDTEIVEEDEADVDRAA